MTPAPATTGMPTGDPLEGLRGYHLPDPVGWWPPAPGWWVLGLVLLAVGAVLGWWWLRRRRRTAAARQAQRELARLRRNRLEAKDPAAFVRGLSTLLRRYVLAVFPRREVAALTGEAWLAFLDRHGGGGRFLAGPGRQLLEAPYRPARDAAAGESPDALAELVEDWIRDNRGAGR